MADKACKQSPNIIAKPHDFVALSSCISKSTQTFSQLLKDQFRLQLVKC